MTLKNFGIQPSLAIAYGMREHVRMEPFKAPTAEIQNAHDKTIWPEAPKKLAEAFVATGRACGLNFEKADEISGKGSAKI